MTTTIQEAEFGREVREETIDSAIIRFCGDSGDGMQLTGTQFTKTTGVAGNDLMTFPDFPAEIRAPQGTLAGVSGFQIHFAGHDIHTPGDAVDVLVAMNPAALKANLKDLKSGGILIANTDAFDDRNLAKVQYESDPLEDPELAQKYRVIKAPITKMTRGAIEELSLDMPKHLMDRSKNFFALGITYWLFHRDLSTTSTWIQAKFKGKDDVIAANEKAVKAGYYFAETSELFATRYEITEAKFPPGKYRNITGATSLSLGLVAGSQLADLPIFFGTYPITPASEILHELSRHKNFGVKTLQAEDEIAAVCSAIGASYGGSIGVTASSGPGICLKLESIGLAAMTELPLIIINAQRGGPSTGLPTKTEQGDLLQALYGRHGDSPIPVISASTPGDAFECSIEAVRIALKFMTPVFLMTDLYLIMGSEPWQIPDFDTIEKISHNRIPAGEERGDFQLLQRNAETLARRWPVPGDPGFEHRIGGLEKHEETGNVNYDPDNHERMMLTRRKKVDNIANFIPDQEIDGEESGKLLVLGWGSTKGSIRAAVQQLRKQEGLKVSHAHVRYLNPFPKNLETLLNNFETVLVPELNMGQLSMLIQAKYMRKVESMTKIKGKPFLVGELKAKIRELL
ncbi:MAG: 2-oxoacid:acceptor oxidoreductase subunit alpha [bacterium]|nr:2-oxoacid:acceptor oxidoreductase subunit alpha [bacterium]